MVAFIYPPLGGSGVQRTLKFSKYLPEFGWQPVVVCSDDPQVFGDGLDASLADEIPAGIKVWRRSFVNPLGLRRRLHRLLGIAPTRNAAPQAQSSPQPSVPAGEAEITPPGMLARAIRKVFGFLARPLAVFEFPPVDAALYWALAIVPGCLRLVKREKVNLIYTTSFPYSDHVTGLLLKKLTGLPWVADFRDPWTQNASAANSGWRLTIDRWIERKVLQSADRITCVTPTYTNDLRLLAPGRNPAYFVTIENGYDRDDFGSIEKINNAPESISPFKVRRPVELAHVGYLYDGTALPLLQSLEALGEKACQLYLRFIGGLGPIEAGWLEQHPLAAQVIVEPRRPHADAVQAMHSADVLLLFVIGGSACSGHLPGKLFEYMASGKPVLLVGQSGDAAELIQRSGTGCFVAAGDRTGLLEILQHIASDPGWFYGCYYQPQGQIITAYERRALTRRLAEICTSLQG